MGVGANLPLRHHSALYDSESSRAAAGHRDLLLFGRRATFALSLQHSEDSIFPLKYGLAIHFVQALARTCAGCLPSRSALLGARWG